MTYFIVLNILIVILLIIFFIYTYKKNSSKITSVHLFVVLILLFYPIGVLRSFLGFESLIGTTILYSDIKNQVVSLLFIMILFFIFGYLSGYKIIFIKRKTQKHISLCVKKELSFYLFETIIVLLIIIAILLIVKIIFHYGIVYYFFHIDFLRQTLTGTSIINLLLFISFFLTIYLYLHNGLRKRYLLYILFIIIEFIFLGYRGPILSLFIIFLFAWQKRKSNNIIKLNFRFIIYFILLFFFFLLLQNIRESSTLIVINGENNEYIYTQVLKRFFGFEILEVVYNKIILLNQYSFNTLLNNIEYFITYIIPRSIFHDKILPVSIEFSKNLFFDIGHRYFDTGGISPTIFGSLLWNFNIFGIFVIMIYGFFVNKIDNLFLYTKSFRKIVLIISLMIYIVLSAEAPENFVFFIWVFIILYFIFYVIFIIRKITMFNERLR